MARFELSIYNDQDEVVKKYEKEHVRWGVFLQAIKLREELKDKDLNEQFKHINDFMKAIFIGITDEELENADSNDILNTFNQLASAIGKVGNSKNV